MEVGLRAPGCLTSEDEERETWTAESLRAASSNGEGFGFFLKGRGHGRVFGGRRFRSTLWTTCEARASQETKVGPRQTLLFAEINSLQLESLILAQSERWRQA